MMILVTIVAFILILSVLVLIHEFGHFIVSKKLGIKVEEFGFGFPPRLFGIKRGETIYSINALPVGGFVKLFGEDEAGGGSIKNKNQESRIKNHEVKRAFFARPVWQRFTVVIAGVIMNFLLAVVLISYLFGTQGVAIPTKNVHITEILKNSPAEKSGLLKNDVVKSINGTPVVATEEFIKIVRQNVEKDVTLTILRNNKTQITLHLTPRKIYPTGEGPLGVGISNIEVKKYSWYEAPFFGTIETFKFSWMIVLGLWQMIFDLVVRGIKPKGVAGPVGVAQLTGQAVSYGVNATLWFTALLSINLAVLNVLPIPALDGGRLFFIVIEAVTRRKVNPKYESYSHAIGLAVLLSLMLLITIFDVLRIISGQSILPK